MQIKVPLFRNKFKKNENQPDYQFSIKTADGYLNVLAGWVRTKKDDEEQKYLSLSIDMDALKVYLKQQEQKQDKEVETLKSNFRAAPDSLSVWTLSEPTRESLIDPNNLPF